MAGGKFVFARGVLVRLVSLFLAAALLIAPAWAQMTLAPSSLPDAAVGTPYSQSFFILGGTAPYHVSLAGRLPVGMTFANEMIAGTPTESGIFSFSVFALDSVGGSDTRGYTLSVRPPTISVSPGSLPDGAVGSAYSQSLSAFGGTQPYSFSVSGTLPPGISMGPTGLLSGTPSSPGSYTFSAIVTDSTTGDGPYVASFPYTLEIAPGSLSFSPAVPDAVLGQAYAHALSVTGGTAPYTFMLFAGALPEGLSLGTDGLISGTPREEGMLHFVVFAQDSTSGTPINGSRTYTMSVARPTITLTPASLPDAQVGTGYSRLITASGGTAPYTYSAVGLPPGLTLDVASGAISGTPSIAGSFNVVATASDAYQSSGSNTFVMHIAEALAISPSAGAVPSATVGTPYSLTISGSGGATPYSYGISSGALPDGLGLDPTTGAIAGTPTTSGVYPFDVTLTDANNGAVTAAYVLTVRQIGAALAVDPPSGALSGGQVGIAYSQSFTASGGSGNYTYTLSGDMPSGLSLDPVTGVLSGMPTFASAFNFTITATDAVDPANTGSATYTLAIAAGGLTLSPTVPGATFGQAYAHTLSATGGTAPYTFALFAGALPAGLSLGPDGLISGTPREEGMLHFVVFAQDSTSGTPINGSRTYSMSVAPPTITLTPTSLPNAQVGAGYSAVITASGGTAPYTYSAAGLPPGLTLDAPSGAISGTPTTAGTASFTVTATDANGAAGSAPYTIAVSGTAPVAGDSTATVAANSSANPLTLNITGGTPDSVAIANPASHGTATALGTSITYTPNAGFSGADSFTYTATNASGTSTPATVTITVTAPTLAFTPAAGALPAATSGTAYSQVLAAAGGAAPYSYTVAAGTLPAGLTLAAGTLSGMPNAVGTASFTVTATDANGATGSAAYTLTVIDAVAPTVISTAVAGSPGPDATSVTFEMVFSETVTGVSASDLVLSTTGSATGTISGLSTDDNITYRASVTAISGIGSLRLDVGAGGSIIDGSGNRLAAAFTSGAAWTRGGSTNAQLSGLAPSTSALSPAFSASTLVYTLTVAHSVDTLALTPTTADPSAMITVNGHTVASGTASPAIPVNVGATSIVVVITAQDGSTTQTYTVTVVRPAPAVIDLTPAAGALPGATMGVAYSQTLAASGGTSPYSYAVTAGALPAGMTLAADGTLSGTPTSAGAASFTVSATDANGATGSAAYTLDVRAAPVSTNAELAGLLPGAGSLQPGFNAGTLSYAVSVGSDVGTITVTPTAADANASIAVNGQPIASGTASRPIVLSAGPNPVQIVVTAEDGTTTRTYTVTVTRAVIVRPDPSQDTEVIGLITAQADTARRFAQNQISNFQGRLEQLHDEVERGASSMDVHLGFTQAPSSTPAQQIDQMIASSHGAALNARPSQTGAVATMPGVLAYGPGGSLSATGGTAELGASPHSSFAGPDLGSWAIWSGGFVDFDTRDNGGLDLDHTVVGVSGGLDYRFSEQVIAGFGVGYGRDRTDIGQNGTASHADAYSAAIYGSYQPIDNLFIDALIGGSRMNFGSIRYVTANGDFATGSRDGTQLFGALTAAYEFRDEAWLISPYGRVEFSRSWLDGFSETSGGIHGLAYGNQTIDTLSGVLGIRANYGFQMDWGTLTPGVRAEYTYDFEGSSQASLGYTDLGGLPHSINLDPTVRDHLTLGLSLDFQLDIDWNLGLDYHTRIGGSKGQDHAFGAKLGTRF